MKKTHNQLRIGMLLNYLNIGLGNLIPIFYTPVMLSLLGQQEYGLYKLSSSVTSYLSLISLGLGAAITRYLIKAREQDGKQAEERVLGLFMLIFQIVAVVSFAVGCVLTGSIQIWYADALTEAELSRMRILVFLMVCNTALSFSMSPYVSVVNAHEEFVFLQCMNIISTCVGPLLNLLILFMGYASIGMAASSLALGVVTRFAYLFYVRRKLGIRARYRDLPFDLIREILTFSFWIFVSNIVAQLYNTTDTIMIGAVPALATVGVAVYNVGGVFNSIVFSMTTGISNLLAPKVNRMVFAGADGDELTSLSIKVGRIQGYIISLLVTGFIVFGKPFIYYYAGPDYMDAYWVAVLMMVPNMIPLVQSVCLSTIIAQNKHRFRSLVYLGIAILNVIGTWFLMKPMGIVGAALMTGIALIFGQGFAMNWYYHRKTVLDMRRFWKEVGRVYTVPVALCAVALILAQIIDFYNIGYMLAGIAVYTVLYCVLNWRITMNKYEKSLFTELIVKIAGKVGKR